ncbi:J-type chaperone JAC1 NDAI_0D03610 [Naumovozyma dairenensis CBS 421]|uniref:J domain-containing protein n=1 Tax=Naumovozyma dairenensis (strain ATCC 10597 / BCRC 20456 / CBS 421 / NBRC 0211 / NRRL Y-12639) TaxID=1071378 RepID=G0WA64_NAUDC|nr:hypothetical protein NDAI_0D03610 [Naumovozyma dairenensis CBS 421]CCD24675.1 hypothetical protein NDAI_0D03610 [Naumovozyma dairenensis CBS 421]
MSLSLRRFFIQKRTLTTFYELFPKTFPDKKPIWSIDQTKLRKEYRALQAQHHPDMVKEGEIDKQSTLLNKAYHVLKEPLRRSQYMIKLLHDIDLTQDSVKEKITNSDPDILMKVIDIHEQLMEIEDENDVNKVRQENQERIDAIEKKLTDAFERKDFDTAIKLTVELKYWSNVAYAIKEWAPGKEIHLNH